MAETVNTKEALNVFKDGIKYYTKHFISWAKYMAFPVFGQILGIVLILVFAGSYAVLIPALAFKYPFFNDTLNVLAVMLLVTLPGFLILLKAFWAYLIAYGAINSITANMIKSGNIYDIDAHKALITQNSFQFIVLWLLISILLALGAIPLLWIPAIILFVYFVLVFQAFTFDEKPNAINAFKMSFNMIKGHFLPTFVLIILTGAVSCVIIPKLFCFLVSLIGLSTFFLSALHMPANEMIFPAFKMNALDFYNIIESISISSIVTMFLLPMRSITWTLWYKKLLTGYRRAQRKNIKQGTKQIDQQILDRAYGEYE